MINSHRSAVSRKRVISLRRLHSHSVDDLCSIISYSTNQCAATSFYFQTSWRNAVLVCGIAPSIPQFVATLLLPDAAKWLLAHDYPAEDARKSIIFFRCIYPI